MEIYSLSGLVGWKGKKMDCLRDVELSKKQERAAAYDRTPFLSLLILGPHMFLGSPDDERFDMLATGCRLVVIGYLCSRCVR
ncbi:hypothetical protein ACLOJK_005592 [Asimina triloba]